MRNLMKNLKMAVTLWATITITIPDALLPRVIDGLCASQGYNVATSTQTKAQFAHDVLVRFIKANVKAAETNTAAQTQSTQTDSDLSGF